MLVASDDVTSGSVIANDERIWPSSSGLSQVCFCASVPYRRIVPILPVSSAEQLNTSGANRIRPMISQRGVNFALVRPFLILLPAEKDSTAPRRERRPSTLRRRDALSAGQCVQPTDSTGVHSVIYAASSTKKSALTVAQCFCCPCRSSISGSFLCRCGVGTLLVFLF